MRAETLQIALNYRYLSMVDMRIQLVRFFSGDSVPLSYRHGKS